MNRNEALLGKLADWRPPEGRQTLHVAEGGWSVTLTADRAEELGCLVWEMALRRNAPAASGSAALAAWAEGAAERATGLLESLQVVEVDEARGEALLRSESPAQRDEQVTYYEVLLSADGSALLRRYRASRSGAAKREQVAFALTHEALAKLAFDLTDAS